MLRYWTTNRSIAQQFEFRSLLKNLRARDEPELQRETPIGLSVKQSLIKLLPHQLEPDNLTCSDLLFVMTWFNQRHLLTRDVCLNYCGEDSCKICLTHERLVTLSVVDVLAVQQTCHRPAPDSYEGVKPRVTYMA